MNQFNIIKIYTIFTQQQGTNSIHVPIDYNPGDNWNISRDVKQSEKFHGLKVLRSYSLFSYHCWIMLEISVKRYLKIIYTFLSALWHLPEEISDLAIESLDTIFKEEMYTLLHIVNQTKCFSGSKWFEFRVTVGDCFYCIKF